MKTPLSSRPLLLIEDNPMDIDLTRQAFNEGLVSPALVVCRDGEEAIRYVQEHGTETDPGLPLLVLLDLKLPKVDGLEVVRFARQHPVWKKIPLVVLTTSRQAADIDAAYEAGVSSYLVKPVAPDRFAEIARLIEAYWIHSNQPPFVAL